MKKALLKLPLFLMILSLSCGLILSSCGDPPVTTPEETATEGTESSSAPPPTLEAPLPDTLEKGILWPQDQALPLVCHPR